MYNPIRFGLLCLIFLVLSGFSNENGINDDVIHWQQTRQLSWKDFGGTPPFGYLFHAETFTGIGYSYTPVRKGNKVVIKWDVHCYFDKTKSWVRSDSKTQPLLNHEQGHFNITELYARELRKVLNATDLNLDNVAEVIEYEYQMVLQDMHVFHNAYDQATQHGINAQVQQEWDAMILDQLNGLFAYGGS